VRFPRWPGLEQRASNMPNLVPKQGGAASRVGLAQVQILINEEKEEVYVR
jgi:hypothetical protein